MKLLRVLALLGADDQKSSKKIYPVLGKTLSKLNTNSLISYGRSAKLHTKLIL